MPPKVAVPLMLLVPCVVGPKMVAEGMSDAVML